MHRAVAFAVTALLVPGIAGARTWYVQSDGSGDAPTIQAAVDSTSPGDMVLLGPGTYVESVRLVGDMTLSTASGPSQTTIDVEGAEAYCLTSNPGVANLLIEGLTLTGITQSGYGFCPGRAAVYIPGDFVLRDCIITGNTCPEGQAPVVTWGQAFILDCEFRDNSAGMSCGAIDPGSGTGALSNWAGRLYVSGCTFDGNHGSSVGLVDSWGHLVFQGNVVRGTRTLYDSGLFFLGPGTLTLRNNLFVDNETSFLGRYFSVPDIAADLVGNTFARNEWFFKEAPPLAPGSVVRGNVFFGSDVGFSLPGSGAGILVECNDSWGNLVNWQGFVPDEAHGNFSADPAFCGPESGDFTVAGHSPLLPENNACAVRIGAYGQACGPVSVRPETWARIKAFYR